MNTSEVLRRALAEFSSRGHARHERMAHDGRVCVAGAIAIAVAGHVTPEAAYPGAWGSGQPCGAAGKAFADANNLMLGLPESFFWRAVCDFNNTSPTAEVEAAFEKAIVYAEAREATVAPIQPARVEKPEEALA